MDTSYTLSCAKCGSTNVFDTGDRATNMGTDMDPDGSSQEPQIPVYQCKECNEFFKFVKKE